MWLVGQARGRNVPYALRFATQGISFTDYAEQSTYLIIKIGRATWKLSRMCMLSPLMLLSIRYSMSRIAPCPT